ncbi:5-formyltetrahydrofolate cyclo-ligase [Polynucleobacter sphagniphilus]|jgi:5,10-methenyltetrahydrofolate synthetase|nr:5-formyltetrahydrofolate cyclo-ligase [Polynucleobacter sphagniphilus]
MVDMHGNSLKTLRQSLISQRKAFAAESVFPQAKEGLITSLQNFLAINDVLLRSVALYCPIQDEIDLRPALLAWANQDAKRSLLLPFARPYKHLEFYLWKEGDTLSPSKHGVLEPNPGNIERPQMVPDCILLPCVGWNASQLEGKQHYWRLGYGGGYFDRTLAQLRHANPKLLCVGIGFHWQKLTDSQWAAQAHDEPLDALITESGLLF